MDIIDFRVRKCEDITEIIDKKTRTTKVIYTNYLVSLGHNSPFEDSNSVKVLRKVDFEKIRELIKQLKYGRNQL